MGLVERQSIRNVVANYAGVLLGMVNKLFLFREWLTREEFGMTELLVTVMVLGSEFSQWGVTKVIFRFFPYYHGRGRRENDFYGFVWVYTFGGILLLALGLLLLGPYITAAFAPNSPLFSGAYLWAIPMAIAYTLYRVGSSLSQSLLASVVPTFAYNVGQRLGQTLLMLAYHFHWLSFPGFVLCFVLTHFLPGLIIGLDLWRKKRLKWSLSTRMFRSRAGRLMIQYGAFSSLGEMTLVLIGRVDMLMLGWLAGEGVVGVYAIAFYISSLIQIPGRALGAIVGPLIARRMKEKRFDQIEMLYRKSAINALIVGGWVLIGIWVNLGALYKVWPDQAAGYEATVLLGISALINLATGANRYIIINSRWYRFDLYANIFLLTLAISLNYFLIPVLKETGAAIATTIAIVLYNIVCTWYVHYRFGVQPFDQRTVKAVAIGAVAWLAGMLVPGVDFPLADMVVRGTVVTLLFIGPVLLLGLSPDLNQVAERWAGKIRGIKK